MNGYEKTTLGNEKRADTGNAARKHQAAAIIPTLLACAALFYTNACQTPVDSAPKTQPKAPELPEISKFTITDPAQATGEIANQDITVVVPAGTNLTLIKAEAEFTEGAQIDPDPAVAGDYSWPRSFTVTSEGGETTIYRVSVRYQLPEDNKITSFSVNGIDGTIDHPQGIITQKIFNGTDITALAPQIEHTGIAINPASRAQEDFSKGPVKYAVTAWNGDIREYTVTIENIPSAIAQITAWQTTWPDVLDGAIDEAGKTITVILPYDASTTTNIRSKATLRDAESTIDPPPNSDIPYSDYSGGKTFTVTAEDKTTTAAYTVRMPIRVDITGFKLTAPVETAGAIDRDNNTITLYVPAATDLSGEIRASRTLSGSGGNVEPNPEESWSYNGEPVAFTVTAPGQEPKTYQVTIAPIDETRYVVYYDANNAGARGTVAPSTLEFDGSSQTLAANTFTLKGNTFVSWNSAQAGNGNSYPEGGAVFNLAAAGGSVTLYATWTPNTYIVKYAKNDGSGGYLDGDQTGTYGTDFTISAASGLTRTGYTFLNWNTKPNGTGTVYTASQTAQNLTDEAGEIVTLYAQWKPVTYTVTYNANQPKDTNATGTTPATVHTYGIERVLSKNGFSVEGYAFVGWHDATDVSSGTSNDGKPLYTETQSVKNLKESQDASLTLYAIWKPKEFSITYYKNASASDSTSSSHGSNFVYGAAGDVQKLKKFSDMSWSKTGHDFQGWARTREAATKEFADEAAISTQINVADGVTVPLYAVWSPKTITVTFNKNLDGSGDSGGPTTTTQQFTYGVKQTLKTIAEIGWADAKTGYRFNGWSKTASASSCDYTDAWEFDNLVADTTLYAVWSAKTFTISYHQNLDGAGTSGDTSPGSVHTYNESKSLETIENLGWADAKEGYTFTGWALTANASSKGFDDGAAITNQIDPGSSTTVMLYAVWEKKE